jgi:hypothetical protein
VGGEEETVRRELPEGLRQHGADGGDEGRVVVEAGHEVELPRPGLAQRALVAAQAQAGVVRGERQPDQPADATGGRLPGRLGDEGRRVLHAHEGGQPQPAAESGRLPAGDRLQRRAADGAVAAPQPLQRLR